MPEKEVNECGDRTWQSLEADRMNAILDEQWPYSWIHGGRITLRVRYHPALKSPSAFILLLQAL